MPADPPAPRRLLIVMPTWLGDCVMAAPTLRALRELYPHAHIAGLIGSAIQPVLESVPWLDQLIAAPRQGTFALARRLARDDFDTAVLLPNSFRSAALVRLARIPRRIGYDRDCRAWLLTDHLLPPRDRRGFTPVPTRDYYLGLARYLGATKPDPAMQLFTDPECDRQADALLEKHAATGRLLLLNPGASKLAKRWPADRFAAVADQLAEKRGLVPAVSGAPRERDVLDAVVNAANAPVLNLLDEGMNLALLKSVMRRARLLITNDTGPRHLAAALGTPLVTLFGPTTPDWTEIGCPFEQQVVCEGAVTNIATPDVAAAAETLLAQPAEQS
ncbi:MAG: lipopolysaccharide heptosyltransferase II [Phycisphaeraceae bacterium]